MVGQGPLVLDRGGRAGYDEGDKEDTAMYYESLDDFIRDLPLHAAKHEAQLKGHDALFLLNTKQGRTLYIRLADGRITTSAHCEERPACTVTADEAVLLELIAGKLNPMKAILTRKVVIQGNPAALMSLIALL